VFPLPFVLFGENLFQPVRLTRRRTVVNKDGIVKNGELLTATVAPQSAHLLEFWCALSRLTLLDRHRFHRMIFYLAAAENAGRTWATD
jgi:hypothetical protein